MYAAFALKPDRSNYYPIANSLSLLLITKPEKIRLISHPDAPEMKRLKRLLSRFRCKYLIECIALFKLPEQYRDDQSLAMIAQIPGYITLLAKQLKDTDTDPFIIKANTYARVLRLRDELQQQRNNLPYFFLKSLFCAHFELTPDEHRDFSDAETKTAEQQRALADSYYQRVFATYVDAVNT